MAAPPPSAVAQPTIPSSRHLAWGLRVSTLVALWAGATVGGSLLDPGASSARPLPTEVPMADQMPMPVPLSCRVGDGPWQGCAMEVKQPGERWTLVVGERRIGFLHDGSGTVRMQDPERGHQNGSGDRGWIPVETFWIAGPALCWNGVCAQGDIPLD